MFKKLMQRLAEESVPADEDPQVSAEFNSRGDEEHSPETKEMSENPWPEDPDWKAELPDESPSKVQPDAPTAEIIEPHRWTLSEEPTPPALATPHLTDMIETPLPPRITAVTPMRNEGPFVLEWIAYHRLIGINDFLVFTNDCSDGTDLILERLDELGIVRHFSNPSFMVGTGRHHWGVMTYSNSLARLKRSDWVVNLDADEFICVNCGDGTLQALFEMTDHPDMISMNQLLFGSSGVDQFKDQLTINQFTKCQPKDDPRIRRGIKTLTKKGAPISKYCNHAPMLAVGAEESVRWITGSGRPMNPERITQKDKNGYKQVKSIPPEEIGYDLVQLNHYAVRSMDSFMAQVNRGNANHPDLPADKKYWRQHNLNDQEDHGIRRFADAVAEEVAWLKSDPELAELHDMAVTAHRSMIGDTLAQAPMAKLREQIARMHKRIWITQPAEAKAKEAASKVEELTT